MKRDKKYKLNGSSSVIIVVMIIGLISICYQIGLKNICVDMLNMKAEWIDKTITSMEGGSIYSPDIVDINWKKLYPYKSEKAYNQEIIEGSNTTSNTRNDKIAHIYSQFEKYSSDYFTFTKMCEKVSKSFNKSIGMNIVSDSYGNIVYKMSDGRYSAERAYKNNDAEANNIISFASYLKNSGINYAYIAVPSPVDPDEADNIITRGYKEYSNVMMDEVLDKLKANNIYTHDLRQDLKAANISWSDVFFKTDHHWRPEYGIWGAEKISDVIDELQGIESDKSVFNKSNYIIEKTDNINMGGFGKSLTTVYTSKDDMEVWLPLFSTNISKTVPKYGLNLNGKFEDVIYDMSRWPTYSIWNHGIQPEKTYKNNEKDNKFKILLLTESYSDVVSPFLACAYSDIEEIDLRCFDGSLETYIETTKPDVVITIYSAYDYNSGSENNLYNFR